MNEPRSRDLRERPWQARDGLRLIILLILFQFAKGVSLLIYAAVMGFSFDQVKELFSLMPGTVEALTLSVVVGGYVAWVFGRSK